MANVTILGAGMMGSALSIPLVDGGHTVRLVGTHLDTDIIGSLKATRFHPTLKADLPAAVTPFFHDEIDAAMASVEVLALGVSSAGVRWAARSIASFVRAGLPLILVAKGLEWNDGLRLLPDVLQDGLPPAAAPAPVAITGPCIAGELARRVDTCVVFAGRDAGATQSLARLFSAPYYHVRTTTDLTGAEIGAALKNAYAMGVGIAAGLHEKRGGQPGSVAMHNYEAAVFTQAIRETQRLVRIAGGDPGTAVGLCGVGDLHVTCNGGRTGRFGRWLGLGLPLAEAVRRMEGATLECLEILGVLKRALPALERRGDVRRGDLPLLSHLIAVAVEGRAARMPFEHFFLD